MFQPTDPQNFFRTVRKEIKLLRSSLPPGIWVKGFEDRMVSESSCWLVESVACKTHL
jgi:hypothetical protein